MLLFGVLTPGCTNMMGGILAGGLVLAFVPELFLPPLTPALTTVTRKLVLSGFAINKRILIKSGGMAGWCQQPCCSEVLDKSRRPDSIEASERVMEIDPATVDHHRRRQAFDKLRFASCI